MKTSKKKNQHAKTIAQSTNESSNRKKKQSVSTRGLQQQRLRRNKKQKHPKRRSLKKLNASPGKYQIIVRDYPNGYIETSWSFIGDKSNAKTQKGKLTKNQANIERSAARAKSRLRQLIFAASMTHMITLTYRSNLTDFAQTSSDLVKFIRSVKTHVKGWTYVAVAERQQRGAWHWHIAVRGSQDLDLLRKLWSNVGRRWKCLRKPGTWQFSTEANSTRPLPCKTYRLILSSFAIYGTASLPCVTWH